MVASCASSRGHIGLTAGPWVDGGGGAAGFIWASAPELSARPPSRAAHAKIRPGRGAVNVFGISGHYEDIRYGLKPRQTRASHTRFAGQRHVVSGAPMWQKSPFGADFTVGRYFSVGR